MAAAFDSTRTCTTVEKFACPFWTHGQDLRGAQQSLLSCRCKPQSLMAVCWNMRNTSALSLCRRIRHMSILTCTNECLVLLNVYCSHASITEKRLHMVRKRDMGIVCRCWFHCRESYFASTLTSTSPATSPKLGQAVLSASRNSTTQTFEHRQRSTLFLAACRILMRIHMLYSRTFWLYIGKLRDRS